MPLHAGSPLPDLCGATEWLNGAPTPAILADAPVLVHFWAVSCHICHQNMPTVRRWIETYAPHGLQVVAVHMPRMEEDTDVTKVRQMTAEMDITEPCAIDNKHDIAAAFENQFVPAYYIFNADGNLVGRAAGYNGLKMIEPALVKLLGVE